MANMSMRDRMLAVIEGRKHDRVPFVQYDGLAAPNAEVWSVIGRENMGVLRWSGVHTIETPNCRFESEDIPDNGSRGSLITLITPAGVLTEKRFYEPVYGSSAVHEHYVKEPEDYEVLLAYLRDVVVREDVERFLRDQEELGENGLPMPAVMRTPWQQLWVQWVSLMDLSLHFVDRPDLVEEVISELTRIDLEIFEVVRKAASVAPLRFVDFPDNITAPAIGPEKFRRYCVPLYNRLAEMVEPFGVKVFVHIDGDLKPLLDDLRDSAVNGIDSLSPPPDNDTTPAEVLASRPDLRVFVNYPSSVHIAEPSVIYDKTMEILEQAGRSGRLQIQVSENVPRFAWRQSYSQIVKAIADFR
ncbi:MAG: hypothetical protein HY318_04340 [Armatimonadetes bacterium]|nr:hypothetical protein [Armatimonadota bacterium]